MLTETRLYPTTCMHCNVHITTREPANKLKLGKWLCFHDSRIKTLHDGALVWIKSITGVK